MRENTAERREFWRLAIQMQQESGLSIARFCERESLSPGSFYAWRRRLQREGCESAVGSVEAPETRAPRLARVCLLEDAPSQAAWVEVVSPDGLILRVRDDASTENVRRVIQLVRETA